MAKSHSFIQTNKNSRVNTRIDRTGKVRTETARRDNGELDVAISTNERDNSTRVFIDASGRSSQIPYADLELNGRQARTLFLALQKHFDTTGKSFSY
jgi:riboflavin biosynthesis pyrimidine reductase